MQLVKQPVKGMRDILPKEKELREQIFEKINRVYKSFGFNLIETPIVEHIENLTGNKGGENEKLTFQILKRGEKLSEAMQSGDELCDCGLRYDLTLPLCRYYANNMDNLPYPFKVFQFGDVFRADRPQKGRTRQFKQCDIDIFGEPSDFAEIELISATAKFLKELKGLTFNIKINDRKLLKAICEKVGFDENLYGEILIILDKMDKIGLAGVKEELQKLNIESTSCDKYINILQEIENSNDRLDYFEKMLAGSKYEGVVSGLRHIIDTVKAVTDIDIKFDFTIVRGMGYYTGTIYEIYCENYGFAVGGGGRYDNMIKDFIGQSVSGVGISIGFERLILVLTEMGYKCGGETEKVAVLFDDKISNATFVSIFNYVEQLRAKKIVYFNKLNKNVKRQKEMLESMGYTTFIDIKNDEDVKNFSSYVLQEIV